MPSIKFVGARLPRPNFVRFVTFISFRCLFALLGTFPVLDHVQPSINKFQG